MGRFHYKQCWTTSNITKNSIRDRYNPISKNTKTLLYSRIGFLWGISCKKSRFHAKKKLIFSNFRGARAGCTPPPPGSAPATYNWTWLNFAFKSICRSCYKWYSDYQSSWLVKIRSSHEPPFSALTLYNIGLKDHIWAITSGKGHDYIWSMNIYVQLVKIR